MTQRITNEDIGPPKPIDWGDMMKLDWKERVFMVVMPFLVTVGGIFTFHGWWLAGQTWWQSW